MIDLLSRIIPRTAQRPICLALAALLPATANTEIRFSDVSQIAGIHYRGPTAASSWGDVDNDGWPDIWVSNHHGRQPNLYLNQRNGAFADIAGRILVEPAALDFRSPAGKSMTGASAPDFHGAGWADFDNDGDQDLIVITGAGAGRGVSSNHLYINQVGKLSNRAKEFGLDYPLGRGRTPLWLDVDNDGRLDVLLMNHPRPEAPSALFLQHSPNFRLANRELGFPQSEPSFSERALAYVRSLIDSVFPAKAGHIKAQDEFAQLADLSGSGQLNLVAYMQPARIYSVTQDGLREITSEITVPKVDAVQDAAIEDFDGDGRLDWFLVRSRPWAMDLVQTADDRLQGNITNKAGETKTVSFTTGGEVTFELHRPWFDPSDPESRNFPPLYIGSRQLQLADANVTVSPADPLASAAPPAPDGAAAGVAIQFAPATKTWTLRSSLPSLSFIVSANEPIGSVQTEGYKPSKGRLKNLLLYNTPDGFVPREGAGLEDQLACSSVAAGDFDNDMDVDLYLVCADPTRNQANLLYENDGRGKFTRIPQAGGAEGSTEGRGNQVAMADYDRDGFLDLFVTNGAGPPPFSDGPHQLFRNAGNGNHWLEIDLQGTASNRDGIGAKITVETAGKIQTRMQSGGMHSFSQNHARIHIGLGSHDMADRVTIRWPSGAMQELRDVQSGQIVLAKEPVGAR